jgi:ribosomal protein S18 acetylase RimI-like enzyme
VSADADALAEMARNRGLKLVRSRVRTPGKAGFGMFGLTDAGGKPVFGMDGKTLTADADAISAYLRGAEVGDWKASLKQVGAKPPKPNARAAPQPQPKPVPKPKPPPAPKLREATPSDAAQLAKLFAILEHKLDPGAIASNLQALKKERLPLLVVARGDRLIAACALARTVVPHRTTPVGRITILVVAEDLQRHGFGRQLMQEAERRLEALGCGLIEVTSNDRLTQAHAFYRRLGYERTSMRFAKTLATS